jgi:hypothetical protein
VDGIRATLGKIVGELAGVPSQRPVDVDDVELVMHILEVGQRLRVRALRQAARPASGRERGTTFGIRQDARNDLDIRVPQLERAV